jgi:hypothetical protein
MGMCEKGFFIDERERGVKSVAVEETILGFVRRE